MARTRHTVLVVGRGEAVCRALEAAGYACLAFEDPLRALARLSESRVDLLVVHGELPLLTGRQVVEAARARGEPLPAILLGGGEPHPGASLVDRLPPEAPPSEVVALVGRRLRPGQGAVRG